MVAGGNRLVVMTGASGGLGRPVIRDLAARGFAVCALCRDPSKLDREIDELGVRTYTTDLDRDGEVEGVAESLMRELGVPWAIVNVVGSSQNAVSWKIGSDDFLNMLEQNVVTAHNVCAAFIPRMRSSLVGNDLRGGRIVNVSSIVADTGAAGASHYASSKAAIVAYTKSLALELAPRLITANVIAPGYFDAGLIRDVGPEHVAKIIERIPLGRLGGPEDLAGVVRFLISDESRYITGQVIHVNGGLR